MEIKVKESAENQLNDPIKKVNAKLTGLVDDTYQELLWSFSIISGNENVVHSADVGPGGYLNYDSSSPTIDLTLPETGEYVVKILAKATTPEEGTIRNLTYHANGDVEVVETVGTVYRISELESSQLNLKYVLDNQWV